MVAVAESLTVRDEEPVAKSVTERAPSARMSWWLLAIYAIATAGFAVFGSLTGDAGPAVANVPVLLAFTAFASIGALVVSRYPRHLVGWVFMTIALGTALGNLTQQYAIYTIFTEPRSPLPGGVAMGWLGSWLWVAAMGAIVFLPLLLPGGHLPSRRWRIAAWAAAVALAAIATGFMFKPGPLDIGKQYPVANPLGVSGWGPLLNVLQSIGGALWFAVFLIGSAGLIIRARRSRGMERQQLKWFGYAAIFSVVSVFGLETLVDHLVPGALGDVFGNFLFGVGVAALPVGTGIAILRYRLYDIDLIVNRTLVYAGLTALLALVYVTGVVGLGGVIRSVAHQKSNNLAVAASTLAVAALFRPARAGVQGFIDRRFYRRRYDAGQTLESFSARLRDEVSLEAVTVDLLTAVRDTMEPTHASLWLKTPGAP
jgi:MFS family permease